MSCLTGFSTTKVELTWLGPSKYKFKQDISNLFWYHAKDRERIQPKDFTTDLGSVPRIFTRLFPRDEFVPAYIIHDWLCGKLDYSRKRTDSLLKEMILVLKPKAFIKANLIYVAVRIGAYATGRWD